MKKLVEEIRKERCKKCLFLRSLAPVIKCGASTRRCREEIRRDIALVFSAVRDGQFDEELGIVGRWNVTDIYEPTGKWLRPWLKEMMFDKDMHTLIAFRALPGTKEKQHGSE